MKRKGFTLIELLAVIVILAIIAVVATPMVLNTIESARKGAAKSSGYSYIESVEQYLAISKLDLNKMQLDEETNYDVDVLNDLVFLKGDKPTSGYVSIGKNFVSEANLCISGYNITYENENIIVNSKCDNLEDDYNQVDHDLENNRFAKYQYNNKENIDGVLKDLSGNNRDAEMHDVEITNDGIIFDGPYADDYISLSEFNYDQISYTVAFRVNENTGSPQMIVGNLESGGCAIVVNSSNTLFGECYIGGAYRKISTDAIEYNRVYVATLTYDGTDLKFYVDNQLVGTYTSSDSLKYPNESTILMLGQNPKGNSAYGDYLEGSIYYVDLHNRELTDTEITYLHNKLMNLYGNKNKSLDRIGLIVEYNSTSNYNTLNTLKDLSGNGNDGSIIGATIQEQGLLFDGLDDYVKIGALNMPKFTYVVDFNMTQYSDAQIIVGNLESGGCAIINNNSTLSGECHIGGSYREIKMNNVEINKDYHAVLTYDGTSLKFYVNSELIGTYTSTSTLKYPDYSTWLVLGANSFQDYAQHSFLNGYIKSLKIYNRALSENEIINSQ